MMSCYVMFAALGTYAGKKHALAWFKKRDNGSTKHIFTTIFNNNTLLSHTVTCQK